MSKVNTKTKAAPAAKTHEGAPASPIKAELQLRRSVMACMLWEDQFYEDGQSITERIKSLIPLVEPEKVARMAIGAREAMKLRHVPLLMVREMARLPSHKSLVAKTLEAVIQRPDELTEFLSIYWKEGRQKLSAQVKKGLASAFTKFSEYSLAKYNRNENVKLKDVLFLSHAKPKDEAQAEMWKRLIAGTLATPDTWEVELSANTDKKAAWTRLLTENKLGALALLRNLRNMQEAQVDEELITTALKAIKPERVLPYRFIAAARFAPRLEMHLETGLFKCLEAQEKIPGKTALLIDVSGSMDYALSDKSDMKRLDVACGLAMLIRETCETFEILTFSVKTVRVPPSRGFALRDAIVDSQDHRSTRLGEAVKTVDEKVDYDRLIVLTDEQSQDIVGKPKGRGYMVNVASYRNGVGYGAWNHIDGWSEAVIDFIRVLEKEKDNG
jgi:60 kDa SS-A/Ro ribonucleoprotein